MKWYDIKNLGTIAERNPKSKEKKIPSITGLVTAAALNSKTTEIKNKITMVMG